MSDGSQVSKVALYVQILRWRSVSDKDRYRAARASKKQKLPFAQHWVTSIICIFHKDWQLLQSFLAQYDLAKHQVGTHAKTPSRVENGDLLSSYIQVKPKLVPIAQMVLQISPSV